jgi:hypothetical protein
VSPDELGWDVINGKTKNVPMSEEEFRDLESRLIPQQVLPGHFHEKNPYKFENARVAGECEVCRFPANYHQTDPGPVPVRQSWCVLHAPEGFGISDSQRERETSRRKRMAEDRIVRAAVDLVANGCISVPEGTCGKCDALRAAVQEFE